MKRHERRQWALRRLGRACEGLEPRQFLSGDGTGIQLLPSGFDPADYADIGPQPASTSAAVSERAVVAAAEEADMQARFASATELEDYLIDAAVRRYQEYFGKTLDSYPPFFWNGWPWGGWINFGDLRNVVTVASDSSHSTTNVQELGVDEADLVETDGQYIYLLQNQELLVFDARPAEQLKLLSRTRIEGYVGGLYLDGDRLTVVSQDNGPRAWDSGWGGFSQGAINVAVIDVADRNAPKLVSQTDLDGFLVSSRMVDGRLYLTITNNIDLPIPLAEQIEGPTGVTPGLWQVEKEADFRARIRPLLQDNLPHYLVRTVGESGPRQLVNDATGIYKPTGNDDLGLTSVVVVDARAAKPSPLGSASVMGAGGQMIYASADNLYVLSTRWLTDVTGVGTSKTEIRKFHFTSSGIELAATGEVDGAVLNQYSLSEHAGYLRVATTQNWGTTSKNHLFVLGEQGTELTVVGALRDLAPGERIFSARLMGNRGFIVTFRQVDPLFTLDLTDPANPRVVGELKLPGFSNYLQVLDENTLLGIGRDTDPVNGWMNTILITIFDVSDMASPKVKDQYRFTSGEWTSADYDPHQVLWDPDSHTLAFPAMSPYTETPVDSNGDGVPESYTYRQESSLWVFDVSPSQGIDLRGQVVHDRELVRGLRIGDVLYSVSVETLRASSLQHPETTLAEARYNVDYVGLQGDLFQPDRQTLLVIGGWQSDRFQLDVQADGKLEVRRAGQTVGRYDLSNIGRIVSKDPQYWMDRVLVTNLPKLTAAVTLDDIRPYLDVGDADGDGVVGLSDVGLLKSQLGQLGDNLAADADRDGDVDLDDLGVMRSNFGARTGYTLPISQPVEIIPYGNLRADAWSALAIDAAMAAQND